MTLWANLKNSAKADDDRLVEAVMSEEKREQKAPRSLSSVRAGERVVLVRVDAGQGLNSRLASMGLVPRAEIIVVSSRHPGPFVVSVRGTKMMLGRGMVQKMLVI